jgi:mersacidin/lichenicidin family type 2 lantibiotic
MLMQETTIRAWRDPMFRSTLSTEELSSLPTNPAGMVELSDTELMEVSGGSTLLCVTVITVLILITKCEPTKVTAPPAQT